MIFIDYPPGGLGNFLAQILTNNSELSDRHASFHRSLKKEYSSLTPESSEQFCQQITSFVPKHEVTVTHSFGNINELRNRWPSATIVQVVARQEIAILLNNMWRKAASWTLSRLVVKSPSQITTKTQPKSLQTYRVINSDNC